MRPRVFGFILHHFACAGASVSNSLPCLFHVACGHSPLKAAKSKSNGQPYHWMTWMTWMTWGYPDIFGKLHAWSIFGSAQKMCICCWLAGDFRKKHGGSDVGTWAATSTRSQQVGFSRGIPILESWDTQQKHNSKWAVFQIPLLDYYKYNPLYNHQPTGVLNTTPSDPKSQVWAQPLKCGFLWIYGTWR